MLHEKVKNQIRIDSLIFRVERHKIQFDEIVAKLRDLDLSSEQKEKLINILRK